MPELGFTLGFYPQGFKGGVVGVADLIEGTGLKAAGKDDEEGGWRAAQGDVINVDGSAVYSVEEALCVVSLAKNKSNVQIVIKEISTNELVWCFVRLHVRAASGRQRYNLLGALDAVTHELSQRSTRPTSTSGRCARCSARSRAGECRPRSHS